MKNISLSIALIAFAGFLDAQTHLIDEFKDSFVLYSVQC